MIFIYFNLISIEKCYFGKSWRELKWFEPCRQPWFVIIWAAQLALFEFISIYGLKGLKVNLYQCFIDNNPNNNNNNNNSNNLAIQSDGYIARQNEDNLQDTNFSKVQPNCQQQSSASNGQQQFCLRWHNHQVCMKNNLYPWINRIRSFVNSL